MKVRLTISNKQPFFPSNSYSKTLTLIFILLFSLFFSTKSFAKTKSKSVFISPKKTSLLSKDSSYLFVNQILITGNKLTRNHVVLGEITLAVGDSIRADALDQQLKDSRNELMNSRLFNEAKVNVLRQNGFHLDLEIQVEERWYIYPSPIFELADRNFNVWWVEQKRDFRRVEYGLRFTHYNFRGRKERLKGTFQMGYTKKLELSYAVPFLDKTGKIGIKPFISYITNNEALYATQDNRPAFYDHGQTLRTRFEVGTDFFKRPDIQTLHNFTLSYQSNQIADTLAFLNPSYFLQGKRKQKFVYLSYAFIKDLRDLRAYPLKGSYFRVNIEKSGLKLFNDVDMFWLMANYSQYFRLTKKLYGVANFRGKGSFPGKQPYFNQKALNGGANYIRGYELSIIDGQSFVMFRSLLKYQLLKRKFTNPIVKLSQFKTIPLSIYIKTYSELGYVKDTYYEQGNPLSNQWLNGTGLGLDIVTMYDTVFSVEYTRNHLGKWGVFVSFGVNYDR